MRLFLAAAALSLTAAPAMAAGPLVSATLTEAAEGNVAVKGAAFRCNGNECRTNSDRSRPAVLCERLVKEVGPVTRFAIDGEEFDADALAACNAKAR